MNIRGRLVEKYETQVISDKFRKREFVIEFAENPNYPEFIKFELIQDKVSLLDPFNVGDMVVVDFNLRGRPWVNQQGVKSYFNSLQAWRLSAVQDSQQPAQVPTQQAQSPVASGFDAGVSDDDDLPF